MEKEEWFAEKTVKGIVYKDVLNLEATMIPNGWGPRVGWKFYPKSDFLNVWDSPGGDGHLGRHHGADPRGFLHRDRLPMTLSTGLNSSWTSCSC